MKTITLTDRQHEILLEELRSRERHWRGKKGQNPRWDLPTPSRIERQVEMENHHATVKTLIAILEGADTK